MGVQTVYDYLERISNLLRSEARRHGAGIGLMPVHLEVLRYLSVCNRFSNTPAAVAEYLGLTKGTVSQTLQLLERNGLVRKEADRQDRRVVHLALTEAGQAVVDGAVAPALCSRAMAGLSETERRGLESGLRAMLGELQAANRMRTFGVCASCRFHQSEPGGGARCGLTQAQLSEADVRRICREHLQPLATGR